MRRKAKARRGQVAVSAVRRLHREEGGQSLAIILALVTILFLMGSALATHASVALRSTVANEDQAGDLNAADAGAELGMWWQRNGKPGNPPAITVNGLNVNTTVGITGAVPCVTPTPATLTGFESGVVSNSGGGLFSAVSGTGASADASVVRSGSYSLRINDPYLGQSNVSLPVVGGAAVVRLYLRLATLPTSDVTGLFVMDASGGNDLRVGYDTSSQRLTIRFRNNAVTQASSTVVAGAWYRLDVRVSFNTNPRTADWQIDGAAQTSISSTENGSTLKTVRLGSTTSADVFVANYDDLYISTTLGDYPIGPGTVVGLRPDGMGASNNPASFREQDGSTIDASTYQRVNDAPMSSTSDYVRQQANGSGDYVEFTFEDTAANCIVGVSGIVAFHSQTTSRNDGDTRIVDGAAERVIFGGDMSWTTLQYKSIIVTPSVDPWTMSAVNALTARVGYSSDTNPYPYWDALLLEVATGPPAVPGTVTVTSTAGGSTITTKYKDAGAAAPTLLSWLTTK